MTPQQQVQRGIDASAVLDNAAYREAMDLLKTSVIQQWKECPIRDAEGQLLLLQLARLADKFDGLLAGIIERGKLEKRHIDLADSRNESDVRKFFRRVA